MIDASPSQATLAASLSDLLVNHQHASVIRLPRHFIPSFFSTSAMSFCFFAHQRCLSIIIKVEKCCTPFTFLNRYGHTLHCIAHKSVQLRSIPFISLRSIFSSSAERQWLSTPVAVRYVPHPSVHCCERILRYIPLRYHSTSYPFASGKSEPSVSYKAAPSWFGKAALSIICQCEKAV